MAPSKRKKRQPSPQQQTYMYRELVHHDQQDRYINAVQRQFQLLTLQQIQIYQYWPKTILELHQT